MNPRISLAGLLVRLGSFVQSLAITVMRPEDLLERSRRGYSRPGDIDDWCSQALVDSGLRADELTLLEKIPQKQGRLLLLGLGGGRDAIPLARMGFEVTGVDFVPEMIRRATANASRHGVEFDTLVQDMTRLDLPPASFDIAWIPTFGYSLVPTRRRRVRTLRRIASALKPGGSLICYFWWDPRYAAVSAADVMRRAIALITLSNPCYQRGDRLNGQDFIHVFSSEAELRSEFRDGGFEVIHLQLSSGVAQGGAALRIGANGPPTR